MKLIYFGSEDSLDIDVAIVVAKDISKYKPHYLHKFAAKLKDAIYKAKGEQVNLNIINIHDGKIVATYKGYIEETNNSIYYTQHLHNNSKPFLVTKTYPININKKAAKVITSLIQYYPERAARKRYSMPNYKLNIAKLPDSISFILSEKYLLWLKNLTDVNILKTIAFQLGQINQLFKTKDDSKIYTKRNIALLYPELEPYLRRISIKNIDPIVEHIKLFCDNIYLFERD